MKIAIIIPAYSRADSLNRLLNSINNAVFPSKDIELIISLDGGYSKEVEKNAVNFKFLHGNKQIIKRKKNLGLKEHILWCGDQTKYFSSVIILEDDLFVDKYFYSYTTEALKFYQDERQIAGISLYGHKYNEYAELPFEPIYNGYSVYFMQVASSWGQAWTTQQWQAFKSWYTENKNSLLNENLKLPKALRNWPGTSWKKYYSAYLVDKNKYFIYPYKSYTTNCADAGGEHMKKGSNLYQVPLSLKNRKKENFEFPDFNKNSVIYDSFMEPDYDDVFVIINLRREQLEIDLYGTKDLELIKKKKYTLTSRPCISPIGKYKLSFHPIENNILFHNAIHGDNNHLESECINLALSNNILDKNEQSFMKLVNFYSYINFKTIKFLKHYLKFVVYKGFRKLI
jgi:hypothetical protein